MKYIFTDAEAGEALFCIIELTVMILILSLRKRYENYLLNPIYAFNGVF